MKLATFHPFEEHQVSARIDDGDRDGRAPFGRFGGGRFNHPLRACVGEAPAVCDVHGG